jgi:hypothetical protein
MKTASVLLSTREVLHDDSVRQGDPLCRPPLTVHRRLPTARRLDWYIGEAKPQPTAPIHLADDQITLRPHRHRCAERLRPQPLDEGEGRTCRS